MAPKYKKRPDGRYLIQVVTGYQPNGRPKYKNVYARTIRELEEKAAKVRDEVEKGIFVENERLTFSKWAERWYDLYKANKELNTRKMYDTTLFTHAIPALGQIRLKELKPHHVQELLNNLVAEGKIRTAEQVLLTINQVLKKAVKNRFIYFNVAEDVEIPKWAPSEKRALTDDEIDYIRSADLPLKEKTFLILLLTTGLRRGEAIALNRSDIDMRNRTIVVNKDAVVNVNKMEIKEVPKSAAGNRTIPMTDELYDCMTKYLPTLQTIYIFPTAHNQFMTDTAFVRMWYKILDAMNIAAGGEKYRFKLDSFNEAIDPKTNLKDPQQKLNLIGIVNNEKGNVLGIANQVDIEVKGKYIKLRVYKLAGDITPHLFRHTYATHLYYAGVDVKTAQYLLGHSSIKMTMDIYTHLEAKKKAQEIMKYNIFMNDSIKKINQSFGING